MTENEAKAVKFIKNIKDNAVVTLDHIAKEEPNVSPLLYEGRKEKANTILEMVEELLQYRAIGTIEECRDAVEKQKPKKPIEHRYNNPIARFINGDVAYKTYYNCPNCNALYVERDKTCYKCGQMLNWSDFRDVVWNRRVNDGKTD